MIQAIANDKAQSIISQADELRKFYLLAGLDKPGTLFAEDFDFLKQRQLIATTNTGTWLDSRIKVMRGQHKHPQRRL